MCRVRPDIRNIMDPDIRNIMDMVADTHSAPVKRLYKELLIGFDDQDFHGSERE